MDLQSSLSYFDDISVKDGYSSAHLFYGQVELYDSSEGDAVLDYRRSISAATVVEPARGVVLVGSERYIVGRTIGDYFDGSLVWESLIGHPADYLFTLGSAKAFIDSTASYTLYGAVATLKSAKEVGESSQVFGVSSFTCATAETGIARDLLLKDSSGRFYRIQGITFGAGSFLTVLCSELGSDVFQSSVQYSVAGGYDYTTDSSSMSDPDIISAFVERYQDNYRFITGDDKNFEAGDKIITVSNSDVLTPVVNSEAVVSGETYRVIGFQSDDNGGWELHARIKP